MMGGKIWATSELGQGSQFHFTLNVEVVDGEEQPDNARFDGHGQQESLRALSRRTAQEYKVLVAEDNPANRMVARLILESAGFLVTTVGNGAEALAAVRTGEFALVLMDCRMPIVDGYSAAQQIRRLPEPVGRVPIIALTASAFQEDRDQARAAGMDDFIAKPFEDRELIRQCFRWVQKGQPLELLSATPSLPEGSSSSPPTAEPLSPFDRFAPEFVRDFLQIFLQSAPPTFDRLLSALEKGDWETARESAHFLRGGAARLIGPELQTKLGELESLCRSGEPAVDGPTVAALTILFQDACRSAQQWLAEQAPTSLTSVR